MNIKEKIIAVKKQLVKSLNCEANVFNEKINVFVKSDKIFFEMLSFGTNAVVLANEKLYDWCKEKLQNEKSEYIMDGDILYQIENKLREHGYELGGECVRYLYTNPQLQVKKPEGFTYKWFKEDEISKLYENKGFDNALNYKKDVIAYGAYKDDKLVALAAADDYMDSMWQIGIDVLKDFRQNGLAAYLVKELTEEIEKRGKIAYYTTWSGNIASTRVALNVGFMPTWISYFAEKQK